MKDVKQPINWQALLELVNHQPELAKELLNMFAAELPTLLKAINQSVERDDYEELKNLVHKLHGSCCYTGATTLRELSESLENILHAESIELVPHLIAELNREIPKVITFIKENVYAQQQIK